MDKHTIEQMRLLAHNWNNSVSAKLVPFVAP